jgi:uncharacterized protein YdhG (YjbR/CyaY superfamily)
MQSAAPTVAAYLDSLPEDRKKTMTKLRSVIRKKLPKGFAEQMQYGMISWVVPHKLYPAGYHCDPKQPLPFAALASQKQYISVYHMAVYGDAKLAAWLKDAFAAAGKKLDMGKSCIRFKKAEDIPFDVIGELMGRVPVADYIQAVEDSRKLAAARKTRQKK